MNNWQYHDNKMKELKKIYNKISKQTQNNLQSIFDSFNIDFDNLYNIADNKSKKRINTQIEEWKEKGLLTGYFGMIANNIYKKSRVKNSEILELLIYGAYIEEQQKLNKYEQKIMYEDANYYYQQGQKEVNKKKSISILDMALFLALLDQPNAKGYVWKQYIEAIIKYNTEQIYRQAIIDLQQQKELDITNDIYQNLIKRQGNSRLNINGDKISGDIDLTLIGINNQAKVEGIYSFDDKAKCKFIAVEDEATTKMCKSLNGQEFYIHDWNEFKRYSKSNDTIKKYRCYGLITGLNLPPINDGFHWCRSYIIYLPPVEKEEKTEYNIPNYLKTKIANNYKGVLEDLKVIQKEYDMLPQNVKERLEKENVSIVLNSGSKYSGYDKNSKEILLIPNLEEGELIHEIGHALEDIEDIFNKQEYIDITNEVLDGNVLENKTDKIISYVGLKDTSKLISNYHSYMGKNQLEAQNNLNNNFLRELISESYRVYYFEKDKLKNTNLKLYNFIEEIEKNA